MGRSTLSKSSKRPLQELAEVLPPAEPGLEANFCRDPNCPNFGRPPDRYPSREHDLPAEAMIGRYALFSAKGETNLKCAACRRLASMPSNVALAEEISCLRWPTACSSRKLA